MCLCRDTLNKVCDYLVVSQYYYISDTQYVHMVSWSPAKALLVFGFALLLMSIFVFWSLSLINLNDPAVANVEFSETSSSVSIEVISADSNVDILRVYVNGQESGTIQPIQRESTQVTVNEGDTVTVVAELSEDESEQTIATFNK